MRPEIDVARLCAELVPFVDGLHVATNGEVELCDACSFTVRNGELRFRGEAKQPPDGSLLVYPRYKMTVTDDAVLLVTYRPQRNTLTTSSLSL